MNKNLYGLKISVCQMPVITGRPDVNAKYMIKEIRAAHRRSIDIIVFPEMCVPGYLIGDVFEDDYFIKDVRYWNKKIIEAVPDDMVCMFGTVISYPDSKGKDGRTQKYNGAIIASGGQTIGRGLVFEGFVFKTLLPDYRFFNDPKHFRSTLDLALAYNSDLRDWLKPRRLTIKGRKIDVGVILCEDMWSDDYDFKPAEILVENGAEIIINLSASPWGWQKNRKRHSVVEKLLKKCKVPLIYVNNTGCQNNGDNIVAFDGSSTVYNEKGGIVHEIEPYLAGTQDVVLVQDLKPVSPKLQNDTKELYLALGSGIDYFFSMLPKHKRNVVIGLSGGVDSAAVAAQMVDILGPEHVWLYNLPYKYSNPEVKSLAEQVALNLKCHYEEIPIFENVDLIARQAGIGPEEFEHQNIQAECRRMILGAKAKKHNAIYTCNGNKTEAAFGYFTLDADGRGGIASIMDLYKFEVRQLAQYYNDQVYKRIVIPQECIDQIPSAELAAGQKDPFDYGYPGRPGYHDQWVKAVVEFRWNPEKFLELYLAGRLEEELRLPAGRLNELFKTSEGFIEDMERCWGLYCGSVFKRIQAPPIIIVSRRAFGRDLEESIMSVHYTEGYKKLRGQILQTKSVA